MPSPTDFNLSPYYDDFSESKNFHRILFRPAFAVQARELTQSQTIIQNQIERLGDHMFKQGAMVIPGQISIDTNYTAVKLTSKSAASLSTYLNTKVTGNSSGISGTVVKVVDTDGTDPDTLYVKYDKTASNNTSTAFTDGETITSDASGTPTAVVNTTATGSAAGIGSGVYYINGFFVKVNGETIILDKYTNTPSYRIGLTVTESFVTSNEDNSLNDNAQGSSNLNAPGAHRFKISLALTKKGLSATDDTNFFEIARVQNGIIKTQVRATQYAVLEDTFARRTYDESGDYVLSNPDYDVREHLKSGDNRGIYTAGEGGLETKLALGVSPFKSYVKGYEIDKITTTFVDVDKAREFDNQNNNKTRYDLGNFVYVSNVYGSPDVGFVSGDVEPFKNVTFNSVLTSGSDMPNDAAGTRGTPYSSTGVSIYKIGRGKSKGYEYVSGTPTNTGILANSSTTSAVYKHYLFDIEMFTHLNLTTNNTFTIGETIVGATSGATGICEAATSNTTTTISAISVANPGVVTCSSGVTFREGQQIQFTNPNFTIGGVAVTSSDIFTVRNPIKAPTNTFELYLADGTTPANVDAFTSVDSAGHSVLVVYNVDGEFIAGETITASESNITAKIQSDAVGFKGVNTFKFEDVKQIDMAGSPAYTSDASLSTAYGSVTELSGTFSVGNNGNTFTGFGSITQTELKIGDKIQFQNDAGTTVERIIESIPSQTSFVTTKDVGGSDVTTRGIVKVLRAKLSDSDKNISLFELPYTNVKTLKTTVNGGITDTNFNVRRHYTGTLSSNGDVTLTAGTNETFASYSAKDFQVSIMTTGSGGTGLVGDVLSLSGSNHEGDAIFSLGGAPVGKTLTLDFGANFAGHKVKILATITRSVANSKTKTLQADTSLHITSQSIIESGIVNLFKADVYKISNVYMSADFSTPATTSDTDIKDRFELDNGQRDNFYDVGRLKLKNEQLKPTGRLLIVFDYFSHGSGDYFDVDSYTGAVTYENIPSYVSDTTGKTYQLRDTLDFRPRVDDTTEINSGTVDRTFDGSGASIVDVVEFGSDVTSDFEYYLNRIDKLFITREGQIKVLKGASDLNPLQPDTLEGHMHLATLNVPAYTLSTDDVKIERVDNKRYTMRDIGRLEGRIQNLEYYTQLSLLEQDAQSLQIQDSNGFDRFKNGFVVDNFTGHNIGDVKANDYKLAVDRGRGEGRTLYNEDAVELEETNSTLSNTGQTDTGRSGNHYQKTGDLLTLPYTEVAQITQPFASKTENLNPFLVFNWIGNIELDPPVDEWKEVERAPDLVVNVDGSWDNMLAAQGLTNPTISEVAFSTEWNEWQDQWSGNPRTSSNVSGNQLITTTSRTVQQTRSGIRSTAVPNTVRQSFGDRVVSINFVPFIRSRTVSFSARGMRPNTRIYAFFDNIDVNAYITPDGGSLGGNLITDANGSANGTFAIPDPKVSSNPRWRTGKRIFRLTASSTNSQDRTNVATSAESSYDAKGLLETQQEVITSTREAVVTRTNVTQDQQVTRTSRSVQNLPQNNGDGGGSGDPLAQSFVIDQPDGCFVTSLDIFFATKSTTIPVRAEIRNMVNGYPGPKVVPFSQKYLNPSEVTTSTDASTATRFTFNSPVYLQEGVEYCIVLYSDSTDYTVYISRLGDKVIGSDRIVSKQPDNGVLFKSANYRTWTPEQMEDLKYTLRRAQFDISTTGTIYLGNKSNPVKTLKQNPIRTFNGTDLVRVYHKNHGLHSASDNVTIAGIPNGTYNGITSAQINGSYSTIKNVTLDSYDITVGGTATTSGDIGGTTVTATQNRNFDVLQLQLGHITHPGTQLNTFIRTTSGKSIHGSETPFSLVSSSNEISATLGDNIYFTSPQTVASRVNEINEMNYSKSLGVKLLLTSTNDYLSPVIDLKRLNAFTITNRVNDPKVISTNTFTGDGSTAAFSLSSTPSSVHLMAVTKNGVKQQPIDDYTVAGSTITFTTAPAIGATITAKLTNTVNFEDATSISTSSFSGSYVTKAINLENPSTALDIRLAASVRSTSSMKCYFRTTGGSETRRITDIPFTPFNIDGSSDTNVVPSSGSEVLDNDFKDYKFSVSSLNEFTSFQIKIVFSGTNSSYPARIKDFRGIALAI